MWRCGKKYGNGNSCDSPILTENELKMKFVEAINEIYDDRKIVLERCRSLLESFDDTADLEDQIDEHLRECEIIAELNRKLLEQNANTVMDQQSFMKKYSSYVSKYEKEYAKAEELQMLLAERKKKADIISAFMFEIHERDGFVEEFDDKLWLTTIDMVTVNHDGTLMLRFKNGMEVTK